MKYTWWTDYLSFVHLCLIKQGWRETNTLWDKVKGTLWVKMEAP